MLAGEKVISVIGKVRARVELDKVGLWRFDTTLIESFQWDETPQGHKFWLHINRGVSPYKDNDYNY